MGSHLPRIYESYDNLADVSAPAAAYHRIAGDFSLRIDFCRAVSVSVQLAVARRFLPSDKVSERTLLLRRESSRICVWTF